MSSEATRTLRTRLAAVEAERDEARTIKAPEDVLEPEWGHNCFRSVLGETYTPKVWGKERALNYAGLREVLAMDGLPDKAHDVIAALIWNRVVVGNNAHHAWEARNAALARAERAEKALEPFAKLTPSTLHPDDGSDAEGYIYVLAHPADDADFTGEDLARARAALSPVAEEA